jgi:hypothetical protein
MRRVQFAPSLHISVRYLSQVCAVESRGRRLRASARFGAASEKVRGCSCRRIWPCVRARGAVMALPALGPPGPAQVSRRGANNTTQTKTTPPPTAAAHQHAHGRVRRSNHQQTQNPTCTRQDTALSPTPQAYLSL